MKYMEADKNLQGNEILEEKIIKMYENLTDRTYADALEAVRERMKAGGHLVVAVRPAGVGGLELRPVSTPDGISWIAAFTGLEEEIKKKDAIMSGFTAEISKLFDMVLESENINGLIINPWDKALKLDKRIIRLIKGNN